MRRARRSKRVSTGIFIVPAKQLGQEVKALERMPGKRFINRGPSDGYDFDEKNEWRIKAWEHFARFSPLSIRSRRQVFMLEGLEGLEIERALRLGFGEENLHVCNVNPAVVAVLKRKYPAINTYGVHAERALERAFHDGVRFNVVSLDFCSCLSRPVLDVLFAVRACMTDLAVTVVNLQRGREQREFGIAKELMRWGVGFKRPRRFGKRDEGRCPDSWPYRRTGGAARRAAKISTSDFLRHLWVYMALTFGPNGHAGANPYGLIHFGDGPLDLGFPEPTTWSRRGAIIDFGSYSARNGLTMGWSVIMTVRGALYQEFADCEDPAAILHREMSGLPVPVGVKNAAARRVGLGYRT